MLCNFRDLGGLPAAGGRRTRAGVLFRSDSPGDVDPETLALLARHGIGRVIDLRQPGEVNAAGPEVLTRAGIDRLSLPVALPPVDGGPTALDERYRAYLALSPGSIAAALEALTAAGRPPTLVHCTSGKDRTGVVIAMALRLAGVTENAVVADYRRSAPNMAPVVDRLTRTGHGGPALATLPPAILRADDASMRSFLAGLQRDCGGPGGWARAHGVAAGTAARLADALLEPEPEMT
jgi:hypothetical protein